MNKSNQTIVDTRWTPPITSPHLTLLSDHSKEWQTLTCWFLPFPLFDLTWNVQPTLTSINVFESGEDRILVTVGSSLPTLIQVQNLVKRWPSLVRNSSCVSWGSSSRPFLIRVSWNNMVFHSFRSFLLLLNIFFFLCLSNFPKSDLCWTLTN